MEARDHDQAVRLAAFDFLSMVIDDNEVLRYERLSRGFEFEGIRVPLIGPQGIFKPRILDLPLSIATAPPKPGKEPPYADELTSAGELKYRYRGPDPHHRDNVGLRGLMEMRRPLIYLHGVVPGEYLACWPVFIVEDRPRELAVLVSLESGQRIGSSSIAAEPRKQYALAPRMQRLHQAAFRERVLRAYQERCAMCRLRHRELLDAAHILPDGDPRSAPTVPNGLSLCKLHHAAFDRHIVGVRPDLVIEVRRDILDEIDGPMLRHGLQLLEGERLQVPRRRIHRPDPAFLTDRYDRFRRAG